MPSGGHAQYLRNPRVECAGGQTSFLSLGKPLERLSIWAPNLGRTKTGTCIRNKNYSSTRIIDDSLRKRAEPIAIRRWVRSSLKEREVSTKLGDTTIDIKVTGGCPQGSCLSPHLWCLIMDGLLEILMEEGFYAQAYANDGLVLVTGKSLYTVCDRMQVACKCIEKWCVESGLSVNPSKTEMMLFTRRRKLLGFKAPKLLGHSLELVDEIRYLGVTIDPQLRWHLHIQKVTEKATIALWQLRRAMGKSWGLSPKISLWTYQKIICPRITYGSLVWWQRLATRGSCKLLEKVQRLACLNVTGAMRTTPSLALDALLGLPPLESRIRAGAISTFLRLRDGLWWRSQGLRSSHTFIEKMAEELIPMTAIHVEQGDRITQLTRKFEVDLPTREQWFEGIVPFPPNSLTVYTDGSKLENGSSGAGIYLENSQRCISDGLGGLSTVFQAEVYAITRAIQLPEVLDGPEESITICSDSQAALKALTAYKTKSALVKECREHINAACERKTILLRWVPGHSGIYGNEQADMAAKIGAETPFCGPEPALGWSKGQQKSTVKKWLQDEAVKIWSQVTGCRQTKMMFPVLNGKKSKWLLGLARNNLRLMTGILTGHCHLRRHLALMKLVESPVCPKCEEKEETASHFVSSCPAYGRLRYQLFQEGEIREEDLKELNWRILLTFIKASKRFERGSMDNG